MMPEEGRYQLVEILIMRRQEDKTNFVIVRTIHCRFLWNGKNTGNAFLWHLTLHLSGSYIWKLNLLIHNTSQNQKELTWSHPILISPTLQNLKCQVWTKDPPIQKISVKLWMSCFEQFCPISFGKTYYFIHFKFAKE